jgi:hypothetical protein
MIHSRKVDTLVTMAFRSALGAFRIVGALAACAVGGVATGTGLGITIAITADESPPPGFTAAAALYFLVAWTITLLIGHTVLLFPIFVRAVKSRPRLESGAAGGKSS